MKNKLVMVLYLVLITSVCHAQIPSNSTYLEGIKKELEALWPENRTINLVFHGHSVPAGYGDHHEVNTLSAYPYLLLKKLKGKYPYAVINLITTAIGGENSTKGASRFKRDVMVHKPDVLFIDYALNDRSSDLGTVKESYEDMIKDALSSDVKVILLTPSPDQRVNILSDDHELKPLVDQIFQIAGQYQIGLADPFNAFKKIAKTGLLSDYMASINHPNEAGHEIIANELFKWF